MTIESAAEALGLERFATSIRDGLLVIDDRAQMMIPVGWNSFPEFPSTAFPYTYPEPASTHSDDAVVWGGSYDRGEPVPNTVRDAIVALDVPLADLSRALRYRLLCADNFTLVPYEVISVHRLPGGDIRVVVRVTGSAIKFGYGMDEAIVNVAPESCDLYTAQDDPHRVLELIDHQFRILERESSVPVERPEWASLSEFAWCIAHFRVLHSWSPQDPPSAEAIAGWLAT